MYGLKDLKPKIKITDSTVECPVKGCKELVMRQKNSFKRDIEYKCSKHKIFISPSTFGYLSDYDNLLWMDSEDKQLYNVTFKNKRESRILYDNSEDAITWNVMRFLKKQNILPAFLSKLSNKKIKHTELILWSYSSVEHSDWSMLNKARIEFGETIDRGTEPDIIILTDQVLYFIEAKFTSSNETIPSFLSIRKNYEIGGNNLFKEIFKSSYTDVTIKEKRYELMRFWLLGTWISNQLGLDFELLSLVRKSTESNIGTDFKKHIIETANRKFSRMTWEDIFLYIQGTADTSEKKVMIDYFNNKTIGYSSKYQIIKAFDL